MTIKEERRAHRAKAVTPEFIMGDVHEDVFKSVFARSVHTYSSMATRSCPFPPVTTSRLDQMSEVNPKSIGNILRGLYDWGFLTPHVRANKTRASITSKGWAYLFFYLNRADFGLDIFTPFAEAAIKGPYAFAEFVKETGLPDVWFYDLCKAVWEHEEDVMPEQKRRPWPHTRPSEAGRFMPCLGEGAAPSAGQEVEEHPIDAIIETRSPRMTDEEAEALYLKRAEDPAQVEIARVMLAREYRKDTRFADMQEVNGLIKEHLTPVETLRFEHRRMWEGPAVGIETLVERMSKAGQFKPTTLADMAPNRLGISDMDAPGHGVSKIAAALRLEDEAAAARNLGTDGQTTLGEAGISLTPPEPAGEETRARLIETLKRIDDGVYDCLADQADAILAALSPEALDVDGGWIEADKRPDTTGDLWLAVDAAGKLFPGVFVNHRIPAEAALVQRVVLPGQVALTPRHEAPASEGDARRKLIDCIDQWDSEMEYDAEDRASLADDILHAFNGPPIVSHEAPAKGAGGEVRELIDAASEVRDLLKATPAMNGREHIGVGLRFVNAIEAAQRALAALSPEAPAPEEPAAANEVPGSTWYSGHKLHIVRGEGSDKRALTLCGQSMTVDFIIESDYDEQHVAYLEREVEHLMDKMNLPHGVQYYRQIDEDMKLLHNKRGYTREHQRVGELEHTVTTVGPAWADAIVAGLIGAAIVLAGLGLGLWSGLLVIAP